MDLLKKVLKDPRICQLTPASITVGGRAVPRTQVIRFKGTETKEYTFEQVLFYLLNKDQKYTTYMGLCKDKGIGKIYYTDQKIIIDEIENAQEVSIAVYADTASFRYIGSRSYEYLKDICKERSRPAISYILVPSSFSSPISLNNVKSFFENGECASSADVSEVDRVEMSLDGVNFVVRDNAEEFTSEDWKKVAAIFLDGSKWQISNLKILDVAEVLKSIPTFYLTRAGAQKSPHLRSYNVTEILVQGNFISRASLISIRERIRNHIHR